MNAFEKQMEFLIEIDKLKSIIRRTKLIHEDRLENDAEHSWHLTMMALVLQEQANEKVDLLQVIKMLMIHDLVEIDAGDTFAYDEQGHEDKAEREQKAAERIFGLLPEEQGQTLMELWREFEDRETPEARFAAAVDRLQPMVHNYKNQGNSWREHGITSEQILKRNVIIKDGSEKLWTYAQEIVQHSLDTGLLPK